MKIQVKNSVTRICAAVVIVTVLVLAGYFFYSNLEIQEKIIDLGMSPQARRNPKLAAKMFMEQSGISAECLPDFSLLDNLPETNDLLIISGLRKSLSEYRYAKLRSWVNRGGNLIVTAQTIYNERRKTSGDPFLDSLGVRQYATMNDTEDPVENDGVNETMESGNDGQPSEDKEEDSEEEEKELQKLQEGFNGVFFNSQYPSCKEETNPEDLSMVRFEGEETPLKIDFSTAFCLSDASETAVAAAGSKAGTHLLCYKIGKGFIIVITDDTIWDNKNICRYDHAYMLWLLAEGSRKVWFLYKTDSPSFLVLLLKNNHILVVSIFLFVILIGLSGMFRFGPVIDVDISVRRQLKEHIDASGIYYWRNDQTSDLINGLRKKIMKKIDLRHSEYRDLPEHEKAEYLSGLSNMPVEDVVYALTHSMPMKENEFTMIVKQIQTLLESL